MIINTAKDWGHVVRDRRIELGLTQEELADRIGRTRWWVLRFEAGQAGSANVESLLNMLDALGLYVEVEVEPEFDGSTPPVMGSSSLDPWEGGS